MKKKVRAKPFSGKQKRQQLKQKHEGRNVKDPESNEISSIISKLVSKWEPKNFTVKGIKAAENPAYSSPIMSLPQLSVSISLKEFYAVSTIDLPTRPPWTTNMTQQELNERETKYFNEWLDYVYKICPEDQIGFFEHNLEVWRQFWRVCEMSDIIVVVLDARFPVLHYPLSLHDYLLSLEKPFILVFMKCDLVDPTLIKAWINALRNYFMPDMTICQASVYAVNKDDQQYYRYFRASGVKDLLEKCRILVNNHYPDEWQTILLSSSEAIADPATCVSNELITIGMLGHPNVGKSSLINSIMGKKVVSASKTPGHTKHFQTIHLTEHIRLCDCPGLIFPVAISRSIQVLNGLYNISQVRDPFGPIMIAGSIVDLRTALKIGDYGNLTVLELCEKFAITHGFYTSKAGRPDINRAANLILRMISDGRILIAWTPSDYSGPIHRVRNHESNLNDNSDSSTNNDKLSDSSEGLEEYGNPYSVLLEA